MGKFPFSHCCPYISLNEGYGKATLHVPVEQIVGAGSILTKMDFIHRLGKSLQIHLGILRFYLDRRENIACTCVYIMYVYRRLQNVKKNKKLQFLIPLIFKQIDFFLFAG